MTSLLDGFPEWYADALCAQTDPDSFFIDKGGSPLPAKRICSRCDVKAECLEYALDTRQPHGIWGGKTVRERKRLLRRRGVDLDAVGGEAA